MPYTRGSWLRVIAVQGFIGLAWLFGDPTRTLIKAFAPAIKLGNILHFGWYPVRTYGLLLIVIAVGLAWNMKYRPHRTGPWSLALAMFWTFWAILFALSIPQNGSIGAVGFAGGFAWYAYDHARLPPGGE